ncbi:MAG: hypothetical protein DI539_16825 [Flavobacterium psychrophilum]|nr:MAG: hypothetical protein DI539_16825 [Flavobacterium psychrophilum]
MLQHGTKTYFTIAKIKNEFYLVYEITGTKYYSGIKPAGNTTYDFVYGYGFYSLVVDGTMQFKDHTGKIVKTLQPVKI